MYVVGGNGTGTTNLKDWPMNGNTIVVWFTIAGLFFVILFSSMDYTKSYYNLDKFGTNQIILVGIVTFLLLYRNISKIKIAGIIEIETRELLKSNMRAQENIVKALDFIIKALPPAAAEAPPDPNVEDAIKEIAEAKSQIKNSRKILQDLEDHLL
jgi:hypothetical protein